MTEDLPAHAPKSGQTSVHSLIWLIDVDGLNQVATADIVSTIDCADDVLVFPSLHVLDHEHLLLTRGPVMVQQLLVGPILDAVAQHESHHVDVNLTRILIDDLSEN